MKRLIVFMLCICVVIPSLLFTSYAETLQGESDENITEERQKEYDSVNIPDSEKEKIRPELQKYYDGYIRDYGDEVKASVEARYDIRQIIDETGFVRKMNKKVVLEVKWEDIINIGTYHIYDCFKIDCGPLFLGIDYYDENHNEKTLNVAFSYKDAKRLKMSRLNKKLDNIRY